MAYSKKPVPTDEVSGGIKLLLNLLYVVLLSSLMRLMDFIILLRWPRLWLAHLRLYIAGWQETPYDEQSFDRVLAARKASIAPREFTYGETPFWAARRLLKKAGLKPKERLVDLGSGRGRVLLAGLSLKAQVHGVDVLDSNVRITAPILASFGGTVLRGDAKDASLQEADVVFLTWSCFSADSREKVAERLLTLKEGARVITITWPLERPGFEPERAHLAFFSWGLAPVYTYRRIVNPRESLA